MNLTLVAYYGVKSDPLCQVIEGVQSKLGEAFGTAFEAYEKEQVHGTIIGLEGTRLNEYIINQNYLEQRKLLKAIKLPTLFKVLKASEHIPFTIQIGGYKHNCDYPFTSRGQHPYLRSFSIQSTTAVAMGWPIHDNNYPTTLDDLRKSLNVANVLHRYHSSPKDVDNDFFFVLGRIDQAAESDLVSQVAQQKMRAYFEEQAPFYVKVDRENLRVVAYNDTRLPWEECQMFTLAEAEANVAELLKMYPDPAA